MKKLIFALLISLCIFWSSFLLIINAQESKDDSQESENNALQTQKEPPDTKPLTSREEAESARKEALQKKLAELAEMLKNDDRKIRLQAMDLLRKMKEKEALPLIINALSDDDELVRDHAASTLSLPYREFLDKSIIPLLIKASDDKNTWIRSVCADILGDFKEESTIPVLIKLLEDKNDLVQRSATRSLINFGKPAVPALIEALNSENLAVVANACSALGFIGDKSALPALIKLANEDDDGDYERSRVRWQAILALCKIADESAVPILIKALDDKRNYVRLQAIKALGELKAESAIEPLIEQLKDTDNSIRDSVTSILTKIGKPAVPALIKALENENAHIRAGVCNVLGIIRDKSAVPALIKATNEEFSSKDNRANVPFWAIYALGQIGDESAVPTLVNFLSHKEGSLIAKAAEALGKIGSKEAVDALIAALANNRQTHDIVLALGNTKDKTTIPYLIEALKHKDFGIRSAACRALQAIGDESAVPALIEMLKDENEQVINAALYALFSMPDVRAIKPIQEFFKTEGNFFGKYESAKFLVRHNAFEGLEDEIMSIFISYICRGEPHSDRDTDNYLIPFGDKLVPRLIYFMKDEKCKGRRRIAKILGNFDSEEVVAVLINALSHENRRIRWAAVESLGYIGAQSAVPALIKLMDAEDFKPDRNFVQALFRIGSKSVIEPLEKLFVITDDTTIKLQIAESLIKLRSSKSKEFYQYILDSANYQDDTIHSSAIWYLGSIGDNSVVPLLLKILQKKNANLTSSVYRALQRIGDNSILPELNLILEDTDDSTMFYLLNLVRSLNGEISDKVLAKALNSQNGSVRSIARFFIKKEKKDVAELIEDLKSGERNLILAAINALKELEEESAVPEIAKYAKDDNEATRQNAILSIAEIGGSVAEPLLIEALNDKSAQIRYYLSMTMGRKNMKFATEALIKRFEIEMDFKTKVSIAAALAKLGADENQEKLNFVIKSLDAYWQHYNGAGRMLGEIGDKAAVPALIKALDSSMINLSGDAAVALGNIGDVAAVPALIKAFYEKQRYFVRSQRWKYAEAVAQLGDKRGIELLFESLDSQENWARESAVVAIGKYGDETAIPQLQKIIEEDYCYKVREAAKTAIEVIKNK